MTRAALLALMLAGCWSMAPRYERPAAPVPAQLPVGDGAGSATAAALPWHSFVHDPRLQKVVGQALANSRDLRRAVIAIESARAQYRIQKAAALPQISAQIGVSSTHTLIGVPPDPNATFTENLYSAGGALATWEIDLFGRLKSLSDAKQQAFLSTVETANATRISLIAEVAEAWVTLAADKSRLAIANDTMASSQRTMDLTDKLVVGGTSNRGDFYQADTVYEQARADVALLSATIAQDRDALELLAGSAVGDDLLPDMLPAELDWFSEVPVGLSSEVLLARPDVLAAEHDLMAANANIGAARAQFFPSLTLTASGGIASTALGALFTGPAFVWNIVPNLAVPLFRGGANRANLDFTKAEKLRLIATYELAVQSAFRDVADALATRRTIAEQLAAQSALVAAADKALELSQARYKAGVDPFLATLVSQRALYTAKNSLVATQMAALGNRVTLYRVLGGGVQ